MKLKPTVFLDIQRGRDLQFNVLELPTARRSIFDQQTDKAVRQPLSPPLAGGDKGEGDLIVSSKEHGAGRQ